LLDLLKTLLFSIPTVVMQRRAHGRRVGAYRETKATYPQWSKDAGFCDCFFRDKFATWIRHPGVAGHLGTDHVNWQGRKSERWAL